MIQAITTCTKNCPLNVVRVHRATRVFHAKIALQVTIAIPMDRTEVTACRVSATVMQTPAIATPAFVTHANITRPASTAISVLKDTTVTPPGDPRTTV